MAAIVRPPFVPVEARCRTDRRIHLVDGVQQVCLRVRWDWSHLDNLGRMVTNRVTQYIPLTGEGREHERCSLEGR